MKSSRLIVAVEAKERHVAVGRAQDRVLGLDGGEGKLRFVGFLVPSRWTNPPLTSAVTWSSRTLTDGESARPERTSPTACTRLPSVLTSTLVSWMSTLRPVATATPSPPERRKESRTRMTALGLDAPSAG